MNPLKRSSSPADSSTDERDATRRKVMTPLLDDDTHTRWVKAVFEAILDYDPSEEPSSRDLIYFLATIVSTSEGRLNPKYEKTPAAKTLLKGDAELMEKLRVAWKGRTLTEISQLPVLQAEQRTPSPAVLGVPIEQQEAVICAWNLEYRGDAHKILLKAVDEVHQMPAENNYVKLVSIAQSSGTGKSKMVDKIATERILFPLCLRENIGDKSFAYPPADTAVRDHLLAAPNAGDELKSKAYLKSFLSSLFTVAGLRAQDILPEGEKVLYADMAKTFYDHFNDLPWRQDFYKDILACRNSPTEPWDSFHNLQEVLMQRCSDWPPTEICPILISMDEIHVLFDLRGKDTEPPHMLYSRLKSVLSEGVSADICVICMSTATSLGKLTPSKAVAPSMRKRDRELNLPVPFTELPFDVYLIADPLLPGREGFYSVGTLEFTAKFGRPLFGATYLSRRKEGGKNQSQSTEGMMLIVREKLLGRHWPPQSPAQLNSSSIAVLSACLLLELSPAAVDARRYEEELVRSHLRMLYSVHDNLEIMVTGSSPEPLIAEASAQIMHLRIASNGNKVAFMDVWHLLQKFVEQGLAGQGTIGELVGRVLSILAMDNAIGAVSKPRELKYQMPVKVTEYYKALLTDNAWETLRSSVPINRAKLSAVSAKKTFEEAFADAYFHFSHYAKANDTTPMRDSYAWANWLRGTAILCQLNQELTDRVHFIYFRNRGNLGPQSMSVDLNQDRTGQSTDPQVVAIQHAETLGVFSHGNNLPYIAAVHRYALTKNEGITTGTPKRELRQQADDQEAPRYQVDFRGLAAYRNLTESTRTTIRSMIDGTKNYLFIKHTWEYGLDLVQQMLPVLTGHPAATAWFGGLENVNKSNTGTWW